MWAKIDAKLKQIIPVTPGKYEQVFGLQPRNKAEVSATTLRNWVTFTLRHLIMKEEKRAHHITQYSVSQKQSFIRKFNQYMTQELVVKHLQYNFQGLITKFEDIATTNNALGAKVRDEIVWKDII